MRPLCASAPQLGLSANSPMPHPRTAKENSSRQPSCECRGTRWRLRRARSPAIAKAFERSSPCFPVTSSLPRPNFLARHQPGSRTISGRRYRPCAIHSPTRERHAHIFRRPIRDGAPDLAREPDPGEKTRHPVSILLYFSSLTDAGSESIFIEGVNP